MTAAADTRLATRNAYILLTAYHDSTLPLAFAKVLTTLGMPRGV